MANSTSASVLCFCIAVANATESGVTIPMNPMPAAASIAATEVFDMSQLLTIPFTEDINHKDFVNLSVFL